MPSKKALWEAQLREWPESVRISTQDMLDWIGDMSPAWRRERLLRQVVYCLDYPTGVFYCTSSKPDAFVGFRFGVKPHQYQSGFPLLNSDKFGY